MALETSLWVYWLLCSLAAVVLVANWPKIPLLLSPALSPTLEVESSEIETAKNRGYFLAVALGWVATLLAAVGYVVLTRKDILGAYQIPDLTVFALLNGSLEQLMFIFWFLLGCAIAKYFRVCSNWKIFGLGFLSYSIYSGFIHGLFWVTVLPSHQAVDVVRLGLLLLMSLSWMWLFWRYKALVAIICMHMVIDFITVGHLHFTWFDSYQLTAFLG